MTPTMLPPPQWSKSYRAGDVIADRYILQELLGRGGQGEVWAAEHLFLKSRVAIKFCRNDLGATESEARALLERFRFEAQVSARLAPMTRSIVLVHDADCDAHGPFMVMELVDGMSLDTAIVTEGPLGLDRIATILVQLADAVAIAHAEGIVHRDLKPANIILARNDIDEEIVKLADFGVAKAISTQLGLHSPTQTSHGLVVGTPDYMSPELVEHRPVGPHTDLWAMAVIAYEALAGIVPFEGDTPQQTMLAITVGRYVPVSKLRADVPAALDEWFARAFAYDHSLRFSSPIEMARAFREAIESAVPTRTPLVIPDAEPTIRPHAATCAPPAISRARTNRPLGGMVGVAFAVLGVAVVASLAARCAMHGPLWATSPRLMAIDVEPPPAAVDAVASPPPRVDTAGATPPSIDVERSATKTASASATPAPSDSKRPHREAKPRAAPRRPATVKVVDRSEIH
ncbi:MAG: protein kinase [Polyangiaceae bacterium]|nr:protein kinase [Polyangiaceae bacterium]